jgi:hypothetical protein
MCIRCAASRATLFHFAHGRSGHSMPDESRPACLKSRNRPVFPDRCSDACPGTVLAGTIRRVVSCSTLFHFAHAPFTPSMADEGRPAWPKCRNHPVFASGCSDACPGTMFAGTIRRVVSCSTLFASAPARSDRSPARPPWGPIDSAGVSVPFRTQLFPIP